MSKQKAPLEATKHRSSWKDDFESLFQN